MHEKHLNEIVLWNLKIENVPTLKYFSTWHQLISVSKFLKETFDIFISNLKTLKLFVVLYTNYAVHDM